MRSIRWMLTERRTFMFLLSLTAGWIILAIVGPLFAPHDPLAANFTQVLQPSSPEYPLGTDQLGRCVLSRLLYGARTSLLLTFMMIGIVFTLGVVIGAIAGFARGVTDTIMMRLCDTLMAFPGLIFAIAVVGMLGPGLFNTVAALSVVWWAKYARMARSLVISLQQKEFVTTAAFSGARKIQIIGRTILPNMLSPLIVMAMMDVGGMMLSISGLSFLGLGAQPPDPEWGAMLNEGRRYLQTAPWLLIYPGLAIFSTVIIFNLLGDSLRDVLDPKKNTA
ncbi:nickel transporter permease [Paenibacillus silvae]|uniref:nickel transporter permease n=1 Tax=Paenibacillus silvae TaxID=1325358 RepID=UPI0011A59643|nr:MULTISPECIES: nickel transporter permease [Paenibacillus]MCK6077740.1 ABC transporter permease [Paenibacillus silvae]MCK6151939.1 ABC transporter permease [Paenibacillus silvae]MCK6270624.1 ABC transporter permease [Paenibacillus silvae]